MDPQSSPVPLEPLTPVQSQDPQQQVVDHIKQAKNVLVTVSNNPSVDQLAACIGLTLALNKLGKHATAVFSGEIPSTIEFLQPEETLEKNTDSLRDFIIALDKSKADKLRYKVEDTVVKIFITPYRTSLSEQDLEFSQGDFNVDVVVALGVHEQAEIDQAITAHGRIFHDAVVLSVNNHEGGSLGAVNWNDTKASSLSEMLVSISEDLKKDLLDAQMATAFLTGIVAETDRFSNDKTTPATMNVSSRLMTAGANQQLIVTKLEEAKPKPPGEEPPAATAPSPSDKPDDSSGPADELPEPQEPPKPDDGTLEIDHTGEPEEESEQETRDENGQLIDRIHIDDQGTLMREQEVQAQQARDEATAAVAAATGVVQPPSVDDRRRVLPPEPSSNPLNSPLGVNTAPEDDEGSIGALSLPPVADQTPLLSHDGPSAPSPNPPSTPVPEVPAQVDPGATGQETLSQIEQSVHSPHLTAGVTEINGPIDAPAYPSPLSSVPAPPASPDQTSTTAVENGPLIAPGTQFSPGAQSDPSGLPPGLVPPAPLAPPDPTGSTDSSLPPPPVPPPMMPPTMP